MGYSHNIRIWLIPACLQVDLELTFSANLWTSWSPSCVLSYCKGRLGGNSYCSFLLFILHSYFIAQWGRKLIIYSQLVIQTVYFYDPPNPPRKCVSQPTLLAILLIQSNPSSRLCSYSSIWWECGRPCNMRPRCPPVLFMCVRSTAL